MREHYIEGYDISRKYRFVGAAVFTHGKGNFLLNSWLGISMILDETCLRPLLEHGALDDDLTFKLYQRGFVRERAGGREEDEEQKRIGGREGAAGRNAAGGPGGCPSGVRPNFFLINLTNNCNLRCRYCFRDIERARRDETTDDMLLRICRYIVKYCREQGIQSFSVQPWGGEPMLLFDKIVWMQDFFREQGLNPRFIMETNGTLIDEKAAAQLSARQIRLGVSIDGPARLHDVHRPAAGGGGSFEKVLAGLSALEKAGYGECGVITVISRRNMGEAQEILTYFAKELKLHRVKLSLIKENTFSPESTELSRISEDELGCFYDTVLRTIVRLNREGYPIYERNICDKLVNLLRGHTGNICSLQGCQGGYKIISFDGEGNIYPCDMLDYDKVRLGNIADEQSLPEMLAKAERENPFFRKKETESCQRCPWQGFCRGGCTASAIYSGMADRDQTECRANRILYPKLIRTILERPEEISYLTHDQIHIL